MTQDLSVQLGADIVYVVGTVNGASVTFALQEGNTWTTTVNRADDDTYAIYIMAYDSLGQLTEYTETVFYGFAVITDRTQADYEEWLELSKIPWSQMTDAQKSIWSAPMKGAYNYTDLNRVGTDILYLQAILGGYGCLISVDVRTDYINGEWPSENEMTSYAESIAAIRSALSVLSTTPAAPESMDDGTVTIWNNIEQILLDVKIIMENMAASWCYAGGCYCGE